MTNATEPPLQLKQIYDSAITYALYTIDHAGRATSWNRGAERIFGYTAEEMIDRDTAVLFTPEDRASNQHKNEMTTAAAEGCAADYRWHLRKNGTRFWADGTMTPICNDDGTIAGFLKIAKDITNRKLAQDEIRRLATVDMLTGLASRSHFDAQFAACIANSVENGNMMMVYLIDLDRFKQVNDTYGHNAGDLLLQQAAQRMRALAPDADLIARLGGDEFVLLQWRAASLDAGADLAAGLVEALAMPYDIDGRKVEISASIGMALCPDNATDASTLLKKADLALYRAKTKGRNGYHVFTDELDNAAHQRSCDIAGIRHALANDSFRLAYQPIVDYRSGRVTAVEALLRFTDPALSGQSVDHLLDLAIETGLAPRIGVWVLGQACAQLRRWKEAGVGAIKMHVNVCSQELMENSFPESVETVLAQSGLQPGDIEIEITEREAVDIEEQGLDTLHRLHLRGIALALDDFGTGYSALSYLRRLPVSTLKLDRSFLKGIPEDDHNCAIAKLVLGLAQALELKLIIEGVETIAQAEFLAGAGCTTFQGFFISKPVDAAELTSWLAGNPAFPSLADR